MNIPNSTSPSFTSTLNLLGGGGVGGGGEGGGTDAANVTTSMVKMIAEGNAGATNGKWVVEVGVAMLVLTLIGSSAILLNMAYNEFYLKRAATVRMRLVQALVISDFLLGISSIVPSIVSLRQETYAHGSEFCNGFGVLLVAAVFGEHTWTLVLAVATYMILCHPLHAVTRFLDKRWIWLYLFVWGICFAIAVIGYELYGYYPGGGICYYGPNAGVYGQLIQFIPRGVVFVIVIVIYTRLHRFLKRPDRIKGTYSSNNGKGETTSGGRNGQISSSENYEFGQIREHGAHAGEKRITGRRRASGRGQLMATLRNFSFGQHCPNGEGRKDSQQGLQMTARGDVEKGNGIDPEQAIPMNTTPSQVKQRDFGIGKEGQGENNINDEMEDESSGSERTRTSDPLPVQPQPAVIPPWERLELPAFSVDGQKYGGSTAPAMREHRESQSHFFGWRGLGSSNKYGASRPTSAGSTSTSVVSADVGQGQGQTRKGSSTGSNGGIHPFGAKRDRRRTGDSVAFSSREGSFGGRLNTSGSQATIVNRSPTLPIAEGVAPKSNSTPTQQDLAHGSFGPSPPSREPTPKPGRHHPGPISLAQAQKFLPQSPDLISPTTQIPDMPVVYPLPALSASGSVSTAGNSSLPSVADTLPVGGKDPGIRRASAVSTSDGEYARRGSGPVTFALPLTKYYDPETASEDRRGSIPDSSRRASIEYPEEISRNGSLPRPPPAVEEEVDEDEEIDFARILAESYGERQLPSFSQRRLSEDGEWQEESMASYLNRKTARLMLYFPIAYVVLFSVSLVRLIWDFVNNDEPVALTAIARWFVFAQGLVDALIYGFVEWSTKRSVRRKVARGAMSPGASRGSVVDDFRQSMPSFRRSKGLTTLSPRPEGIGGGTGTMSTTGSIGA